MVEELDAQHIDVFQVFHRGYIDVLAFSDVQEHTIDEKQECFDVQVLAPRETQVEEELRKSFVVNTLSRLLLKSLDFLLAHSLVPLFDLLRLGVRVEFIFLLRFGFLLNLLFGVLLCIFSLEVYFPVLFG